jgi:hypothetical protein
MPSVGHLGSKLEILFVEQDADGNAEQTVPVRLMAKAFSFPAYLELFRQAWEQRNEVRKGLELPPLPLPESYRAAVAAVQAEAAPRNGHAAGVEA